MTDLTDATAAMTAATEQLVVTKSEVLDWAVGTEDGGPEGDGHYPFTAADGTKIPVPSPAILKATASGVGSYSTDLWLNINEPSERIQMALDAAYDDGKDIFIPRKEAPYMIEADGPIQPGDGIWRRCLVHMHPGVSIRSNQAVLQYTTGRTNPPGFFGHWRTEHDSLDNIELSGVIFDGGWKQLNPSLPLLERYSFDNYAQHVDVVSETPWRFTQLQHMFQIHKGDRAIVNRCKFTNGLGYGPAFGDTYQPTATRGYGCGNPHVYLNEFENLYHGGIFMPAVWGGCVEKNYFHGDGYYVAAIDLERHNLIDEVTDVEVRGNVFDFRDGYGPVSFGSGGSAPVPDFYGRKFMARMRKSVSIGFFGGGYTRLGRGHKIHHNRIYQGQIDSFGQREIEISHNNFEIEYEDMSEVANWPPNINLIGPDAIVMSRHQNNDDMSGCKVNHNTIVSDMDGWGVKAYGYDQLEVIGGTIEGGRKGAILRQNCSGDTIGVQMLNAGIEAAPAPMIRIDGAKGPTRIMSCSGLDNRVTVVPGPGPTDPPASITPHYGSKCFVEVLGLPQYRPQVTGNTMSGFTVAPFIGETGSYSEWGNNVGGTGGFNVPALTIGRGDGPVGFNMIGEAGSTQFLSFWDGDFSNPRTFMGVPGDDKYGFVLLSFKPDGTAVPTVSFNGDTRQMLLNHLGKGLVTAGKFDAPLGFIGGGVNIWGATADGMLRKKTGAATSDTDGNIIAERVAVPATLDAPGRVGQWAADSDTLFVCTALNTWKTASLGHEKLLVGDGTGNAVVELNGGAAGTRAIRLTKNGVLNAQLDIAADNASISLSLFDDAGAYLGQPIKVFRFDQSVRMEAGPTFVAGTWDKPLRLGNVRLWANQSTGVVYTKLSNPTGPSDGTAL